jgi:hypothetical protein
VENTFWKASAIGSCPGNIQCPMKGWIWLCVLMSTSRFADCQSLQKIVSMSTFWPNPDSLLQVLGVNCIYPSMYIGSIRLGRHLVMSKFSYLEFKFWYFAARHFGLRHKTVVPSKGLASSFHRLSLKGRRAFEFGRNKNKKSSFLSNLQRTGNGRNIH